MSSQTILDKEETLSSLPPEWPVDLTSTIASRVSTDDQTIVAIDDDPTGTQTVYDLPVLTEWSEETIEAEFHRGTPAFYIMTNSRSLTPDEAASINETIAHRLIQVAKKYKRRLSVISRSDSTLRGHYPLEIDVLAKALSQQDGESNIDGQLIIPFFLEGGRLTIHDVHYVAEGKKLIPAAETPFAKDAAFGFTNSNLLDYVEEKTQGRFKRDQVQSITIEDIRKGGPDIVRKKLATLSKLQPCVVNAVTLRDMQVLALGLLDAEAKDQKRILVRSAASFVQARIGLPKKPLLNADTINSLNSSNGGLVVVGSYVPKTTTQLESLLTLDDLEKIKIEVSDLVDEQKRDENIDNILTCIEGAIASGKNAVVYTTRKLVTGATPAESLAIGNAVSQGLVSIVSNLKVQPRFLIAKGGITSSDVATKGLGIRRAMILGQAAPGIPVWSIGEEGKFPGMSYVVFPGNVGGEDELKNLVLRLSE
eukprot:CAMPEP_0194225034 /NCGR_PEP_ID=MMETSP0156-20130528/38694_1 /TAXON_ID=33649 /ORGANISM="Thalassionema nitzschioides, Strain L26-B" /LENGTH=478 /DNA_ID=CAMNT_0038956825 /DNA_START=54 /DNA_END=1490 /DNA_ORIENTATION=+